MSSNYPEGSMRGSGIDAFEFEYGSFTCECGHENEDVLAYGDDYGNWEVVCEKCAETYETGTRNTEPDPDAMYEAYKESLLD